LFDAWNATFGSTKESYCHFVEKGLEHRNQVFLPERFDGWIMGSEAFAQRMRKIVSPQSHEPNVLRTRSRPGLTLDDVLNAECSEYGIASGTLVRKSSRHPARPIVALLASENSTATLQEIATALGLADRQSVPQVIQTAGRTCSSRCVRNNETGVARACRQIRR
jgi:hypothetical protein